ncbi:hypothetical protein VD0002_g1107 [Verticillium dahliae]|uniref:GPI anchored protein n=1 Tax=Verticillium dahliae TaxID=27337 RepID=A0A2J8FUB4_VERDA|nr:hypothetical protein BJF96_g6578 [Verticillium dahliae]PNH48126.1 hypothetical protein VD0004_g257 [Verticillium dahliae]PNH55417.1 hypothetical protein VD0003_g2172 [Verticillium dahliae]PNH69115.1 hypothetical protein VD0002_g1107 [Verticillium dahliae]PNH77350.1 hypothetical protein VD0001_g258 [Verticillium dahliae]
MQNRILPLCAAIAATVPTASASRSALRASRDAIQGRSFLCPVVCDTTWCCLTGQTCQESSDDDAPYECADSLFETTEAAFALVPLSRQIESIIAENSLFLSSLTAELSLTLTFTPVTTLPDLFEPTTVSDRPVITEPLTPPATTTLPTSTSSRTQGDDDAAETGETSVTATSTTSTASRTISPSAESSSSSTAATVSGESGTATSTRTASISTETSALSGPVTTTSSQGAAPTAQSQWQHGMAVVGLVIAAVL